MSLLSSGGNKAQKKIIRQVLMSKSRQGLSSYVTCKLFGAYLSKLGFSLPVSVFVVMMPVCCVPKLKRKCEKVERDDEDKLWWQSLLYRLFRGVF